MNIEQLLHFIETDVKAFSDVKMVGQGCGYHYTSHVTEILRTGKFLGAPINSNLAGTQRIAESPPATSDPGVVFAYPDRAKVCEQGLGQGIMKIHYRCALSATHLLELPYCERYGLRKVPTLLILTSDITSFEFDGTAERPADVPMARAGVDY